MLPVFLSWTSSSKIFNISVIFLKYFLIRLYPDLPPPTYNESVFGVANVRHSEDDEHTGGDFQFVPRYVTYNTYN